MQRGNKFMIYYGKLFEMMKAQGKNTTHIREGKNYRTRDIAET